MFAVIETGGKQYLVSQGGKLQVEKLPQAAGAKIKFEKVLFFSDGKIFEMGKPYLSGKTVEATIVRQGRSDKVRVFKYKAKSKYRRAIGHRQQFTEVEITKI